MRRPSLIDLVVEARAREQCEDEFFFRSPKGPQKPKSICTKCLTEEVELPRARHCRTCKLKTQDQYNKNAPSRVARLKNKSLLRRYEDGEL